MTTNLLETLPPGSDRGARRGRTAATAMICAASLLLAACASTPPPVGQLAVSAAAIENAVGAGGPELAPVEMMSARENMKRASAAMADKDYDLARAYARAAEVDAKLAEANAESIKATRIAAELQEGTRVLREELERKTR
jgi:hypothetical protein